MVSCAEVAPGYEGTAYEPYSGGVNPDKTYQEGVHMGIGWFLLGNEMIQYNLRQITTNIKATLLDKNGLEVGIDASVFHRVMKGKSGYLELEKGKDYETTYIVPVFEGALKNVIGKYTAQELYSTKRNAVQVEIKSILDKAFGINYIKCDDIIIRDVNLPKSIQTAIIAKEAQDQKNELAEKMKLEEENIAKAKIAKADGDLEVAKKEAQTRDLLSQPKMLELQRVENERIIAQGFEKHGFGNNNVW